VADTSYDRRENAALAVELFVPDVRAAVAFYADTLGFEFLRADDDGADNYTFAALAMGEAFLMLMSDAFYRHDLTNRGAGVDVRVMVPDVDAVYKRVTDAGAEIANRIGDREYGLRDFIMRDPWGFRLRFASLLR
jgi:uncharacterized glyoxalase superfamily protein PhnB